MCSEQLKEILSKIATVSHYGGLLGLSESSALVEIRKLTIPYINQEQADRLQRESLGTHGKFKFLES